MTTDLSEQNVVDISSSYPFSFVSSQHSYQPDTTSDVFIISIDGEPDGWKTNNSLLFLSYF